VGKDTADIIANAIACTHRQTSLLTLYEHSFGSLTILNICRVYHHGEQQSYRIYQDVAHTTFNVFASIFGTLPAFSFVLTD
jgi:hypothetical protein